MTKKRIENVIICLVLLGIEILIALFAHDYFIRGLVGDILVVAVIYYFIRIFFPVGIKYLLLYVFIFAVIIEIMQLFHVGRLISGGNEFAMLLLGDYFSVWDIFCYAVGGAITGIVEKLRK